MKKLTKNSVITALTQPPSPPVCIRSHFDGDKRTHNNRMPPVIFLPKKNLHRLKQEQFLVWKLENEVDFEDIIKVSPNILAKT